jgi:hypothetical protein
MAFTLAEAGHVRLAVHDIQGRQVALLANADMDAGPHGVDFSPGAWNARPGLYLATLQVAARTLVRRFFVFPRPLAAPSPKGRSPDAYGCARCSRRCP